VVFTALAGVLVGVLVFVGVLSLVGSGKAKSHLGQDRFVVGKASALQRVVAKQGPLLFADLAGGSRDIYVQYLDKEWHAFEAHAPGAPRRCQLQWQKATADFRDPCTPATYPADGQGLRSYLVAVDRKGRLIVDLRQPGG
jgi:hypothetical protein